MAAKFSVEARSIADSSAGRGCKVVVRSVGVWWRLAVTLAIALRVVEGGGVGADGGGPAAGCSAGPVASCSDQLVLQVPSALARTVRARWPATPGTSCTVLPAERPAVIAVPGPVRGHSAAHRARGPSPQSTPCESKARPWQDQLPQRLSLEDKPSP